MKDSALFDKIGGDALRVVITEFYRRVFDDVMIGFMFQRKDRAHLIEREWELVASLLGAPGVTYKGRPMRTAHANHTIFGGHFERRLQILREVMRENGIDHTVQDAWIEHSQSLRSQITRDKGSECGTTVEGGPKLAIVATAPSDVKIQLGRRPK